MEIGICNTCINKYPECGKDFNRKLVIGVGVIECDGYKNEKIQKNDISKTVRHMNVCKELNELYESKNHDYGDSFAKVRKELGNTAILVRLYDKIERLKTLLLGAEQKVKDENIEDSFKDLANYCLMELVERQVDKNN